MKLLIDGYNLIRSVTHRPATPSDIQHMLGRLRRYQRATKYDITLVFDGGEGAYRYKTVYHGLTMWYSGFRETADDLIKDFLRSSRADELVLISDDRQLNEVAEKQDIVSVSPLFFLARVAEREGVKPIKNFVHQATKTSDDENSELDALMYASTNAMRTKEEGPLKIVENSHKKASKIERRLEALIRKL